MDDLIEIVRQYKVIYDTKCKQYKDNSIRTAVWEEIGEKLKQPPEKCKDDWNKLRNAYINALKRRKNKKSGQAAVLVTPWKYEEQMSFLQPFIKSRPSTTNIISSPESTECFEPLNLLQNSPEPQSPQSYQSEHCLETPHSGTSSHAERSSRMKTNLQDLYDLMKSSHDLRFHKHFSKQQDMDETDLFFLSMSKALKSLPKLDQTKIKLDLHTAISQAEIRNLHRKEHMIISKEKNMITPMTMTHRIIS
ncbi:transcription factor Adf-1-like [Achroia grisella]|uniref:transcription factor Adf-1-like n=1 Tax=Achroia grisella TaxID=688607 RepID=UPI0027D2D98A|nr:transcription factor Adf-1-like [Achroia grisella]